MLITLKTIRQHTFKMEVDESQTVRRWVGVWIWWWSGRLYSITRVLQVT